MSWLATSITAAAAACVIFLTYQEGSATGRIEGYAAGYAFAVTEQAEKTEQKRQEQDAIDQKNEQASMAYRKRAEAEIAALGKDAARAKRELAQYLKETHEEDGNRPHCNADARGASHIDSAVVGMLNEARAKTDPDLRAGRAPSAAAAGRADDTSTGPQAPTWADLALSDQESSQTYHALATKHDKLVSWVQTYCVNNKESGE